MFSKVITWNRYSKVTFKHISTIEHLTREIANSSFNDFIAKFKHVIDKHAPFRKLSRRQKKLVAKPWITKGILVSMKKKQKMYYPHFKNGNIQQQLLFKKYSNKLTKLKTLSRRLYYEGKFQSSLGNSKNTWNCIKSVINKSNLNKNSPKCLLVNDKITNTPIEIADAFNNFFASVGLNLASSFPKVSENNYLKFMNNKASSSIYLSPPQDTNVFDNIMSLKPKKSCGRDDISNIFMRTAASTLTSILTSFYSLSLKEGIFFSCVKTAKVVQTIKSGNVKLSNNYWPISLISSFFKILEKLILKRLMNFFDKHKVLHSHQYGFIHQHSTEHAILDILSTCYNALESKTFTGLLMIDLKKVFDTVDHKILLQKLQWYGIRGVASDLIKFFFCLIEINMCQLIMSRLSLKKSPTEFHKVQS